jgi:cell wall assembly regulator SMI1
MTDLTPLQMREAEVAQYQANIEMYAAIAATLPNEWPENLVHLKGAPDKHSAIADVEDLDDVELVSDLWAYDAAQAAIRSETVEMRKAKAILTVMQAQA